MYKYFQGKHVIQRHHTTTLVRDNGGLCIRRGSSSAASSLMINHNYVQQQPPPSPSLQGYSRYNLQVGITSYNNWTKLTSSHINYGYRHNSDYQNGGNRWGGNRDVDDNKRQNSRSRDVMGTGITVTRKKGKETGYCYGCGADLVKEGAAGETKTAPKKKGFWADQKDYLKKAQIKNWALCPRCRQLKKLEEGDVNIDEDMSKLLGPNHLMTDVFREEVGTIRKKEKAVVVMCIDSINVSGTLIRTIRNYVGGNPILLAITRCDLLPDYVYEDKNIAQLKAYYLRRCAEIQPAAVYLCSEDKDKMQEVGGIKELASDLWEHLNGRDPYVIGAANIGKSTLTDILIAGFINRGTRMGHFRDRLALKRVDKLREARITKSALPGTTLQNIRVPCFVDHQQALWDTPGLLLDESTAHFPIRNFREIRAKRPNRIMPHIYAVPKKSFCLLITEKDDEFPLIRVEIRLKKDEKNTSSDGDEGSPVHVVWNSTLDLDTHIEEIKDAHLAEQDRFKRYVLDAAPTPQEIAQRQKQLEEQQEEDQQQNRPRTEEERKRRKEEKRLAYLARVKAEQEEVGKEEWYRREAERKRKFFDEQRSKVLAKLVEVNQTVVEYEVGMDVAIANFGWIGFACSRTAMIKVYAPNSGVRVVCTPTIALPSNVGHYRIPPAPVKQERQKLKKKMGGDDADMDEMDEDDMDYDDIDMEDEYGEFTDDSMDYGGGYEYSGFDGMDDFGYQMEDEMNDEADSGRKRWYNPEKFQISNEITNDHWGKFSGKNVGWQFDADLRFTKRKDLVEGWVCYFCDSYGFIVEKGRFPSVWAVDFS